MTIQLERVAAEGFDAVARDSREDFLRIARYLLSRWRTGPDIDEEDVLQELMLAAWQRAKRFDAARSPDINAYALFQARSAAKTAIRKSASAAGRIAASRPSGEERAPHQPAAIQLADLEPRDAVVLAVYCVEESRSKAARRIFADQRLRRQLGAKNTYHALTMVHEAIERLKEAA